jgi:hypothetical protein
LGDTLGIFNVAENIKEKLEQQKKAKMEAKIKRKEFQESNRRVLYQTGLTE